MSIAPLPRHTDATTCVGEPNCLRWHTDGQPEYDMADEVLTWPGGTKWTAPDGQVSTSTWRHSVTYWTDVERNEEEAPVPIAKPEGAADTVSHRESALNEAKHLIMGDRNAQYGPPTQDFRRTAELLNALGYRRVVEVNDVQVAQILPSDVAIIIAQVKVSRLMHSRQKRDSWVDLAGYAGCGYECAVEEGENAS